jgi:hypothetical protein
MESWIFSAIVYAGVMLMIAAVEMRSSKAERRIRAIEQKLGLLLQHFGIDPNIPPSEQVRQLAADPSKKLRAIRLYCKETGADIRTSAAVIAALDSNRNTA